MKNLAPKFIRECDFYFHQQNTVAYLMKLRRLASHVTQLFIKTLFFQTHHFFSETIFTLRVTLQNWSDRLECWMKKKSTFFCFLPILVLSALSSFLFYMYAIGNDVYVKFWEASNERNMTCWLPVYHCYDGQDQVHVWDEKESFLNRIMIFNEMT